MQAQRQTTNAYQHLLDETGSKIGLARLSFDEQGTCWLRIGDTMVVLRQDLRLQGLLLLREVDDAPSATPLPFAAGASLHPLLDGKPVLCHLPDEDRTVCMAFLPLLEFDPPHLLRMLARLVDWRPSSAIPGLPRETLCLDPV
ncbi:MAG: CesT family type III secretion system chaperone [Janthinobacterium lividum]